MALLDDALTAVGLRRQPSNTRVLLMVLGLRARLALRGLRFVPRSQHAVPPALLGKIDVCRTATAGHLGANLWIAFEFHTRRLLYALDAGEPVRLAEAISRRFAAV